MSKKNQKIEPEKFEDILGDSLKFHGLLTKATTTEMTETELPEHLTEPNFLFENKEESLELPKLRIAALKASKQKK